MNERKEGAESNVINLRSQTKSSGEVYKKPKRILYKMRIDK